jgi:high-affinity K+ transport system ATPase subunit B
LIPIVVVAVAIPLLEAATFATAVLVVTVLVRLIPTVVGGAVVAVGLGGTAVVVTMEPDGVATAVAAEG